MNYIVFGGSKYKVVPLSKLGVKRNDSLVIFYTKCEKINFKKFVKENPMEYRIDSDKYDELYIKKFKFFEYIIYYKNGYLVLETPIRLRQLTEVGDRYYAVEENIYRVLRDISGEDIEYKTEIEELPFRNESLNVKKCLKEGCNLQGGFEGYCGKHLIIKSLRRWLFMRYSSEYEWVDKIEIFIY